jgi:hypothetical protein
MRLLNPYLEFFLAMPSAFQRDPLVPVSAAELLSPEWLKLKAAIAGHFAWAVPTEEAIRVVLKYATNMVEIGAGSGYWAWMMRQVGIAVAAFDAAPPPFTWSKVDQCDERAVSYYPYHTLFVCWPPWNSDMAYNALACYQGNHFVYVGEWMGGSANPRFFGQLATMFELIDVVDIPPWQNRDDRLMIFRRLISSAQSLLRSTPSNVARLNAIP